MFRTKKSDVGSVEKNKTEIMLDPSFMQTKVSCACGCQHTITLVEKMKQFVLLIKFLVLLLLRDIAFNCLCNKKQQYKNN